MIYIAYFLLITIVVILLSSVIPIIQFVWASFRGKTKYTYLFPLELYDRDFRWSEKNDYLVSRQLLATRGWIRGPHGSVMTNESFQVKKNLEYEIDLP